MSLHDRFLDHLVSLTPVRLVAALRDSRLGFPNPSELRLFIPDLHLISEKRRQAGGFKFATNCESRLTQLLTSLPAFNDNLGAGQSLLTTQIGDVLDLWREAPGEDPRADVPARIANDHWELMHALRNPALDATIFLGNHDFDLYRFPSYAGCMRKLFFPDGAPQVLVLHGDVFDWIEELPDGIQNLLVYLFSPEVEPNDYVLGQMSVLVKKSTPAAGNRHYIHCPTPAALGPMKLLAGGSKATIPARYNVQVLGQEGAATQFLTEAADTAAEFNARNGLSIRTVVIGHTHHARIAVRETGSDLFTLIDCGAWIEKCSADGENEMPSAQIGVLCGNEARIYQLASEADAPPA